MSNTILSMYEIFYSIQGESYLVGHPTVFVRTAFCNLDCFYCDEPNALKSGYDMTISNIISEIEQHNCKRVCLTGGEPLRQHETLELIDTLISQNYSVSIETNGTYPLGDINPNAIRIMDLKLPMPYKYKSVILNNLQTLRDMDELKVVIKSEDDFNKAVDIITEADLWYNTHISFSPLHNDTSPAWLCDKIAASHKPIRLNVQLHKYIWPEDHHGK